MRLYRPVGVKELELIAASGWSRFPPRLFHQPIFYPVLNFQYAQSIAKNRNTKDQASGFAGFVTEFDVDDAYVSQFDVQVVGARDDQELWVPAEELDRFNQAITGRIRVTGRYFGPQFSGVVDPNCNLPSSVVAVQLPADPLPM